MSETTPVTEIRPNEQALHVVVLPRILDESSTQALVDDVLVAAAEKPRVPIVLDFARVRFAPSVALGALVRLSKSFKLDNRRVALVGMDHRLRDVIQVTQLHKVLEIHHALDDVIGGKGN